jgi:DNA invertase Pin-like site-specific DNA recombinase
MATYGYARVSTARQADEDESLDVQERQIGGYSTMHCLTVDRTCGVSGSTPLCERAQGAALLAVLKPGDVAITSKLDRMFRSALNALDVLGKLKARGVSLHMIHLGGDVTGNGVSKLVFTILSTVAGRDERALASTVSPASSRLRLPGWRRARTARLRFSALSQWRQASPRRSWSMTRFVSCSHPWW